MDSVGHPFTGFLYAGLMLVNNQPYVIEFNASEVRNQKLLRERFNKINSNINIIDCMCMKKKANCALRRFSTTAKVIKKIAFLKTLPKTSKVGPLIAQTSILGSLLGSVLTWMFMKFSILS